MITRRNTKHARPPPQLVSPYDSTSSEEVYATPPENDESSSDDELLPPAPRRAPALRRGRPPLPCLGSVGRPVLHPAPAVGGVVRRMRWTNMINKNGMRAYYGAIERETNLTAYRSRMLSLFQILEPGMTVTTQRLTDQVRFIKRNNVLDDATLDRLRSEVTVSTPTTNQSQPSNDQANSHINLMSPTDCSSVVVDVETATVSTHDNEQLRRALEDSILEFRQIPASGKPRLPRFPTHNRKISLVVALDRILDPYLESSQDLADTHSILYYAAIAACRVAHTRFPDSDRGTRVAGETPHSQNRIEQRINAARTKIGKLICFRSGNTRPRVMRFVTQAFAGTKYIKPKDKSSRCHGTN
ncbi:uncharacterized protein LOC126966631 [Leptidea sinapis]|uniref:uncharacterized protein LOC126966631 n=1 Tax=Leptidea sinapis TaxID=189913 RepID=UPI0021C316BD|nr:uncharacterized protein LOC126966631 [Leptidea sinapis]